MIFDWCLLIVSVLCMVIGHIFKVKRWGLFISVHETPSDANLLNAMIFGHTLNTVFPIRIGDFVRFFWAGRKLKNGYAFSLATVVADIYIDFLSVGMMLFGLTFIDKGRGQLQQVAQLYSVAFLIVIPMTILSFIYRKYFKLLAQKMASVFNEKIEFVLLYTIYLCIASLKDIANNIEKKKFLILSFGIWSSYVASYAIFAQAIQRFGYYYTTSDIFALLFSGASLYRVEKASLPYWIIYLLLSLGICWFLSLRIYRDTVQGDFFYRQPLPQMNRADQLAFLKMYYAEENRDHLKSYLELNRDINVISDNSAGSHASTLLIMMGNGKLYYRKYAFDEDGNKLRKQIEWIESHQKDIPLPIIAEKKYKPNYAMYDMRNYSGVVSLFHYIHTMPIESSWEILKYALRDIEEGIHSKNRRNVDKEIMQKYISLKVTKNLEIVKKGGRFIRALEQYDTIWVNGKELHTLKRFHGLLAPAHLESIFLQDEYSDIHGDFTIENIICVLDNSTISIKDYKGKIWPEKYYFIDPNVGNLHESPFLDYAKMLQSLHGGYEFLTMVNSVEIANNRISYLITRSEAYGNLYRRYHEFLRHHFSDEQIMSIYFHEVVHWLRLMPYKIEKDEKTAVIFYTGLLQVLHDVEEMEYEGKE